MQQATGALINQASRTTTESSTSIRSGALGALYGAAFCFLAATVVSVWAAYDGAVALNRFFLLLSGILAVMAAPLLGEHLSLRMTAAGVTALSNLLVLGVALGYGLQRLGVVSPASGPAWLLSFSDNQAAQLLAVGLSFTVASIWLGVSERRKFLGGLGMVALLPGAAALALTASRGAWLGIAAAALVALYLFVRTALQQRTTRRSLALWLLDGLALLTVLALLGFYLAVVASPAFDAQVGASAQGGSALSRIALWRDSIPLIEDYFFTGSGLGVTAMVYATYAYLLHVPYLYHAHNLYVQVALEQGAPALLAWLVLVFATVFYAVNALRVAESTGRSLVIAGLAALTALLVHGLFDAELYASALATLAFYAPAALLWSAASVYADAAEFQGRELASGIATGIGVLTGAGLPLLLALLLPGAPARWEANLGAVLQTRAELSRYRWPEWSFQDQVRRQETAALAPAEAHFAAALLLDPTQPTAHRRLGAIALARGEFDRARDHLTVAYQVEPYDRATRQLLGEVLALDGDIAGAVRTWQGLDVGQGQFMVREWWYQAFGQPEQVEKLNDAVQAFERTE
jgi:O-antigen ligase